MPVFSKLGYNYKLSDINAAIVVEQLKKYPRVLERKGKLVKLYEQKLKNNQYLTVPKKDNNFFNVYQTYAVVLDKKIDRDKIILAMKKEGIETQIGTYASHVQPIYQSSDQCPNSLFLFKQTLALPLFYELKEQQVEYVAGKLNFQILKQVNS